MRSSDPKRIIDHIEDSLERAVDTFLTDINKDIKQATPKSTGYAARQWRYSRPYTFGYDGTVIENRASYIAILDQGSSRQAPDGMTEPVISRALKRVRRNI